MGEVKIGFVARRRYGRLQIGKPPREGRQIGDAASRRFDMSLTVAVALAVTGVGTAVLGVWIVRKVVPVADLQKNHSAGTILHRSVGTTFSVLLSFVVAIAWTQLTSAAGTVSRETGILHSLYLTVGGFPSQQSEAIRLTIRTYAEVVADQEWPLMGDGRESTQAEALETELWNEVVGLRPASPDQQALLGEQYRRVLSDMTQLDQSRQARLLSSQHEIPAILWALLIGGGITVVLLTLLFATDRLLPQLLLTGALATFIACALLFLSFLDNPYGNAVRVSPEPFRSVAQLSRTDSGP